MHPEARWKALHKPGCGPILKAGRQWEVNELCKVGADQAGHFHDLLLLSERACH